MEKLYLLTLLSIFVFLPSRAQTPLPHHAYAYGEAGFLATPDERTPFWLRANQYGTIPLSGPAGLLRAGIRGSLLLTDTTSVRSFIRPGREWTLHYAAEAVAASQKNQTLLLPEAYVQLTHRRIEITAGRRREIIGVMDSTLSVGSHSWSGNALPIPKVQIGTRGFIPVGRRGRLAVNAFMAHGWFGNTWYVKQSYLHQKSVIWRIGRPTAFFRFYFGMNHSVQWAGRTDYLNTGSGIVVNGYMPNRLSDFPNILFGIRFNGRNNPRITQFDWENMYGNTVGSFDFAGELRFKAVNILAYHQHAVEDGGTFLMQNFPDGLTGIRLRSNRPARSFFHLNGLALEFYSTMYQSGPPSKKIQGRGWGGDNYFNHAQYQEGWIYRSRVIGSPFLSRQVDVSPENRIGYIINNNRVQAGHLGMQATIARKYDLLAKVSYSENRGTYNFPFPRNLKQWSTVVQIGAPLPVLGGCFLTAAVAVDAGRLLTPAAGGYLALRKTVWKTAGTRESRKPAGRL
ncbi:capsule assembly Wzi family protein [Larkinella soli]|uniref:capsule assembly Wzi family protein n=1 Tax=Larkinella soli TaxID=1770527 RepID=UPI000FFB7498|nr:capsule assembly Wzi family protein [Larkinella soli]